MPQDKFHLSLHVAGRGTGLVCSNVAYISCMRNTRRAEAAATLCLWHFIVGLFRPGNPWKGTARARWASKYESSSRCIIFVSRFAGSTFESLQRSAGPMAQLADLAGAVFEGHLQARALAMRKGSHGFAETDEVSGPGPGEMWPVLPAGPAYSTSVLASPRFTEVWQYSKWAPHCRQISTPAIRMDQQ